MKFYLPGLNGLRAIAALIVIAFHLNATMWFFGSEPIRYIEAREEMSRHAVVLFFVLSGFLITCLLIKEKEQFNRIDIRKFYIRRILRIWPLFYAAILLAVFFIPTYKSHTVESLKTISLYALFVPNFAMMAGYRLPTILPLWSVGVEEQFYAVWPVLLNKSKNIILFLVIFLLGYIALKVGLQLTGRVYSKFSINLNFFSYDTMAIGGIAAWLYTNNHRWLTHLYNPLLQVLCWLFFGLSCILGPLDVTYIFNKEIYSVVFAIIILNVSTNPATLVKINGGVLEYLGRISYGMYVLHAFVIVLTAIPLKHVIPHIPGKPLQLICITVVVLPLTIWISQLSHTYFERWFLRLKDNFTRVSSTNEPPGIARITPVLKKAWLPQ